MLEAQQRIIEELKEHFPNASKSYSVCTDTFGSIATAFPNGKPLVDRYVLDTETKGQGSIGVL